MDSKHRCVELNDGHVIPVLGFGTYASETVTTVVLGLRVQKKIELG
jgi:hypothetical protein